MRRNTLLLVQQTQHMIERVCDQLKGRPRPVNDDTERARVIGRRDQARAVWDELERCFPRQSRQSEALWLKAKSTHPLGLLVRGKVVACAPFGVFLDIGAGFPVLLLIHRFADYHRGYHEWPEDILPVGSVIAGRVIVHDDLKHQIGITQRPPILRNRILEYQVEAALSGHELGSFSRVNGIRYVDALGG